MLYSRKVCCTLPSTSSNESLTNIHAKTAYLPTHLYMQSFTVYIYIYFFHRPCPMHIFHRKTAKTPNSPAVRSSLSWSGCGCLAVAGSSSFTAFSPAAPIATLAPHGQTNRSLEVNLQVARCWQRPLHAHFLSHKKRVSAMAGKQITTKKQLRHVEARPNKKEQDTQAHEHSNCLEHILELLEHICCTWLCKCCSRLLLLV